MKKIIKKLKAHSGETIAEVLIALLISTLGLLMLATMINSSANSITRSRKVLEDYYSSTAASGDPVTVKISFKSKDGSTNYGTYTQSSLSSSSKTLGGVTILSYTDAASTGSGGGEP